MQEPTQYMIWATYHSVGRVCQEIKSGVFVVKVPNSTIQRPAGSRYDREEEQWVKDTVDVFVMLTLRPVHKVVDHNTQVVWQVEASVDFDITQAIEWLRFRLDEIQAWQRPKERKRAIRRGKPKYLYPIHPPHSRRWE